MKTIDFNFLYMPNDWLYTNFAHLCSPNNLKKFLKIHTCGFGCIQIYKKNLKLLSDKIWEKESIFTQQEFFRPNKYC